MEGWKIKSVNYAGQKTICESYTQMKGIFEDFLSRVPSAGFALSLQVAGYRGLPKQIYSCNEGRHQVTGGNSLEEVLHIFSPKQRVSLFSFILKWKTHLEINHFLF